MDCNELVNRLLRDEVLMPTLFAGVTVIIVLVSVLASTIKSVARERTRREIAAYIAEGTMTPEQGEKLMRAGNGPDKCA